MPLNPKLEDDFDEREQYAEPSTLSLGLNLKTKPKEDAVITFTKREFLERQDLFNNKGKIFYAIKFSLLDGLIEPSEDFRFVVDETDKSKNPYTTFMKEWKELDITAASFEKGLKQLVEANQFGEYTPALQMSLDLSSML